MGARMLVFPTREEWLKNRGNGIGGSEISAIIGCNPYLDNVTLWEHKTNRKQSADISDKSYVKYGQEAEPLLRELFKLDFPEYEVFYEENNSFINDKYPWSQASLDGWLVEKETGRKGILEIKTTEILQSMQKEKWNNRIPDNYYCQVLMYMAVLEADFAVLKCQMKSAFNGVPYLQTKHYFIEKSDVQDDIIFLMQKGEQFWECVKNDKCPAFVLPPI